MLKTLVCLILAGVIQAPVDTFKREMGPLQSDTDKQVTEIGAQVLSSAKATLIDGYGVVVTVEVALEAPVNPLFPALTKEQVMANVSRRQKEIREKVTALAKQRVASLQSIGPEESLAIVVHLLNANPAMVKHAKQFVFSVKKSNPEMVVYREI